MAAPRHDDAWVTAIEQVAGRVAETRRVLALAAMPTSHPLVLAELVRGPATVAEIAESLGWTVHRVGRDLRALQRTGWVTRSRRRLGHRSRAKIEPDVWSIVPR